MDEIKIENNLNAMCHACLCNDRQTTTLGEYSEVFSTLIGRQKDSMIYSMEDLKFCWECTAMLKRFKTFQNQLKKAQDVLMQMLYEMDYNPVTLSKLAITNKYFYDEDYQHIETESENIHKGFPEINADVPIKENAKIILPLLEDIIPHVQMKEDAKTEVPVVDTHSSVDNIIYDDMSVKEENDECDSFIEDDVSDEKGYIPDNTDKLSYKKDSNITISVKENCISTDFSKSNGSKKVRAKRRKLVQSRENSVSYYKQYATLIPRKKIDWGKVKNYFTMITFGEAEMEEHFLSKERKFSEYSRFKYKCERCELGFMRNFDLKRHNNLNHSKSRGPFKCSVCHKAQPTLEALEKHWREHTPIAKCNICGDVCRPRGMKNHLNYSHTKKYACQFCRLEFGKILHFSRHYKEMHQDYYCDYCNACCKSKILVQKHIRTHHTKFSCKECDRQYPNYRQYKRHNYEVHPEKLRKMPERPELAYCVECDKQYPNERKYKKHLKISPKHADIKPVMLPCPDCGKIFRRKNYLNNHYNLFHLKKSKYHCELCDKYFANGYGLRKHTTHVHLKVSRIKDKMCDLCGRGFATNRILENHRRTHTGERPYQCPFCVAAFTQKQAMQSHCRTQHKDMK